ncbi:MAG: VOC family protein [Chloroflexi bacterium]|nr:VOC family protein [Chloroflexota bacterium]MCI0814557.1 VOC family protein [Chloroflexota bacterium]MCI0819990.1 VOC family protein [Chloroflexota bacterium]MCI0831794.1 VOC family protein [Chloroflexota bacterium]
MTRLTVAVYTENLEKLLDFYEAALGVKPQGHGDWRPFNLAVSTFAVHAGGAPEDHPSGFNVSIEVDDIDAALARCEAHGARVLEGVSDEAFGRRAVIEDPDGRTLQLLQVEMG